MRKILFVIGIVFTSIGLGEFGLRCFVRVQCGCVCVKLVRYAGELRASVSGK